MTGAGAPGPLSAGLPFSIVAPFVLYELEGGAAVTDDPRDPGGLTKWGIALKRHPELTRERLLSMTAAEAAEVYRLQYWEPAHCDDWPPRFAALVMDSAIHQGVGTAIELVQECVGVEVDRKVGPKTISAAWVHWEHYPHAFETASDFLAIRLSRYRESPHWGDYGDGWTKRLFRINAFAFSELR